MFIEQSLDYLFLCLNQIYQFEVHSGDIFSNELKVKLKII